MKVKRQMIPIIVILLLAVILFAAYQLFRFPTLFRHLSDNSLPKEQVEILKNDIAAKDTKKVLVAYFSYSGTTQRVANELSAEIGADLFEISPQTPYSNVYLGSNMELRRGERPPLADTVTDMEQYDVVFLGYPVWFHATSAPINTFLESYDLNRKLIIPFCTSGCSDISETMQTFLDSCENLAVYGAKHLTGAGAVSGWLDELALNF